MEKEKAQPRREKATVSGILYSDLEMIDPNFVKNYESKSLRCSVCNDPLFDVGIYAVRQDAGVLKWCCTKYECVESFQ